MGPRSPSDRQKVDRNGHIVYESPLYHLARGPARGSPQAVGSIIAFTPSGSVTVRSASEAVVEEGTAVHDRRGLLDGRVVRVFGPVARPYLLVRPRRSPSPVDAASLLGAEVLRG